MTAKFPTDYRQFTAKVDLVDTVYADHVNALQEEVRALETTLGTATLSSDLSQAFSFATSWSTVSDRLANIERGLVNGVTGAPYLRDGSTTNTLTFKQATGTSDSLVAKDQSNVTQFRVDYQGLPYVGNNAVLYVNGPAYQALQASLGAAVTAALTSVNPFLLAGM